MDSEIRTNWSIQGEVMDSEKELRERMPFA